MSSLLLIKSMLYADAIRKANIKTKDKNIKKKMQQLLVTKNKKLAMGLCRICNKKEGNIPIFSNKTQPSIPNDIQNFSGVKIDESDNLPKHMCQWCLDLLNGCILFRDLCQSTNKRLVKLSIRKETSIQKNDTPKRQVVLAANDDGIIPGVDAAAAPLPSSPQACSDDDLWKCKEEELFYKSELSDDTMNKGPRNKRPEGWKPSLSFLCDTCGKTTRSRASLAVHMLTHENVFPFKCETCPYRGRTIELLKVHKRSHLEDLDRPFKCSQCPKSTTTSSNLAKHMRNVHSDNNRPDKCSYCERAFTNKHDLKRHVKDIHLRQGTVECDICFKKYNTRKILQGHRLKVHKIKGLRLGRLPSYLQCQIEVPETEPPVIGDDDPAPECVTDVEELIYTCDE